MERIHETAKEEQVGQEVPPWLIEINREVTPNAVIQKFIQRGWFRHGNYKIYEETQQASPQQSEQTKENT